MAVLRLATRKATPGAAARVAALVTITRMKGEA